MSPRASPGRRATSAGAPRTWRDTMRAAGYLTRAFAKAEETHHGRACHARAHKGTAPVNALDLPLVSQQLERAAKGAQRHSQRAVASLPQ